MELGVDFLEACDFLGIKPPSKPINCKFCGREILFVEKDGKKKPVNASDNTCHDKKSCQKHREHQQEQSLYELTIPVKNSRDIEIIEKDGKTYVETVYNKKSHQEELKREELCNFTMRILEAIRDDEDNVSWSVELSLTGWSKKIELVGVELNILARFCEKISSVGPFLVNTTRKNIHNMFVQFVLEKSQIEHKKKTDYLGRIAPDKFLFCNGVAMPNQILPPSSIMTPQGNMCIVVPQQKTPKQFVRETMELIFKAWPHKEVWKVIGFAVGSLFVEEIVGKLSFFPLLFLNGEQGCGKTSLGNLLLSLFGAHKEIKPFNIHSTQKAWMRIAAKYKGVPVIINEFQPNKKNNATVAALYDREGYIRARKSNDNQVVGGEINGTFGLISTREIHGYESEAVTSRIVKVKLSKEDKTPETRKIFSKLSKNMDFMSSFVPVTLAIPPDKILDAIEVEIHANMHVDADARIRENHCIIKACLNTFLDEIDLPQCKVGSIESDILKQYRLTQECNVGIHYIKLLVALVAEGQISKIAEITHDNTLKFSLTQTHPYVCRFASQAGENEAIPDMKTLAAMFKKLGAETRRDRIEGQQCRLWYISLSEIEDKDEQTEDLQDCYVSPF